MLLDRTYTTAFVISLAFHALLVLVLPGQSILEIFNEPEWLEVDLLDIPSVEITETQVSPFDGKPQNTTENAPSNGEEGTFSDFTSAPLWLPERLDSFDEDPVSNTVFLPDNVLPDITGISSVLPLGSLTGPETLAGNGTPSDAPPEYAWMPGSSSVSDIVGENPDNYLITGPVSDRKIIFRPPPPRPITSVVGTVQLKFWVNPDGTVGKIVPIVRANPDLERIAIEYIGKWRFETLPAGQGKQWGTIPIRFKLN